MKIIIPEIIFNKIRNQAKEELPNEACGYLSGTENAVKNIHTMTNVDKSSEHFSFDPKEQFSILKEVRKNESQLIGVYHSHPTTPARMSEEDKRLANDTNIFYLIYSVCDDTLNAFKIDELKNVQKIEIQRI